MDMTAAAQRSGNNSPRKSYGVLRSIIPNKDNQRSDIRQLGGNEMGYMSNPDLQGVSVPLLPAHETFAPPPRTGTGGTEDPRVGRPSSISKENPVPEKHRRSKSTVSLKSLGRSKDKDGEEKKEKKSRRDKQAIGDGDDNNSRRRFKKTKSTTSLRGLFTKNRSSKDLSQSQVQYDKENLTPSPVSAQPVDTPIWSQFATAPILPSPVLPLLDIDTTPVEAEIARYTPVNYSPSKQRDFSANGGPSLQRPPSSDRPTSSGRPKSSSRPKSALIPGTSAFVSAITGRHGNDKSRPTSKDSDRARPTSSGRDGRPTSSNRDSKLLTTEPQSYTWAQHQVDRNVSSSSNEQALPSQTLNITKRGSRVMAAVAAWNGKAQEASLQTQEPTLDPKSVDAAFEAVLDSRNIPENMRQRMRTLTLRVKADFIKQDRGATIPTSPTKSTSRQSLWASQESERAAAPTPPPQEEIIVAEEALTETKKSRARSKTFAFSKNDSSKKHKADSRPNSIHIPKSTFTGTSPLPSPRTPSGNSQRGPQPADPQEFVCYLKSTRDPTQVEVGRLHKLRLLLRNETVAWVDYFISLGGMTEVVDLLHRIMAIEWREEHEDQLLHETLLCLKGLCTTEVALAKLEDVADTLFTSLLALLFDEEKKGPSEFNTRGIIINVIFAHLSAASERGPEALARRARSVLKYLCGPKKPEDAQPVSFVLEMHKPRPYRVWCNEVNNVTREVFWIFLHHLNVIPLPQAGDDMENQARTDNGNNENQSRSRGQDSNPPHSRSQSYAKRHFPGDRPPVPAAPYIGGVEWDATTYMTAHLDLLNGLVASLPTRQERNTLRSELKDSGWEKVMGATLRTCKEKFYCGVHGGLQSWIAAALEDDWDIEYVRYGPTQEEAAAMSPRKSPKKTEPPPQLAVPVLDIPKLSIGLGGASGSLGDGLAGGTLMTTKEGAAGDDDDGWLM
ncbi:hypothetical protein AAFC00_004773 [Neodothiora populina]|uniref:Formin GTPase-binding domain-containing protein n=1 Tax=Neodothiora populina TaxID=2781224 RepID=A0ABR3P3B1_9PEZI